MKTFSGFLYSKVFGWKVQGEFPDVPRSVTIFGPHTSNWDSFLGKLYLNEIGIKYYVLAKKELFTFPMGILMRAVRALPIDRAKKNNDYVSQVAGIINSHENIHIFIAPEGTRRRVAKWKKGFYHIAKKANVPVIAVYLDYARKEIGVKGVISDLESIEGVMKQINSFYADVSPKYPENFCLENPG